MFVSPPTYFRPTQAPKVVTASHMPYGIPQPFHPLPSTLDTPSAFSSAEWSSADVGGFTQVIRNRLNPTKLPGIIQQFGGERPTLVQHSFVAQLGASTQGMYHGFGGPGFEDSDLSGCEGNNAGMFWDEGARRQDNAQYNVETDEEKRQYKELHFGAGKEKFHDGDRQVFWL